MRFCSSRRAISKRACSISLMALSNSTLSGCWVSLVMGLVYFLRRMPQPPRSTATAKTTAVERIAFRTIITQSPLTSVPFVGQLVQAARDPGGTPGNRRSRRGANPPQDSILPHMRATSSFGLTPGIRHLANNPGSLHRDLTHLTQRRLRVRTVKDRRPCDDPVTPRAHHVRQILFVHAARSEEHTSELQSLRHLVCRLL